MMGRKKTTDKCHIAIPYKNRKKSYPHCIFQGENLKNVGKSGLFTQQELTVINYWEGFDLQRAAGI